MIDSLIRFSIKNKLLTGLFVFILIGWGTYSLVNIPIDAVPDITDNQVQVITNAPNLAAQEVEQLVTYPLELSLSNLPGIVEIRSVSRFGLSVITAVFEESTNIYLARQLIQEQINQVMSDIPEESDKPYLGPISTGLGMIYQYVLKPAPGYDSIHTPMDLRTIQDWVVKRQLSGIKGVVEINSSGGYVKNYEVAVDQERLRSLGITISQVFEALKENNRNTGASYIENKDKTYFIRGEGRVSSFKEIENIKVLTRNGIPIKVSDLGEVHFGSSPRFGAVTIDNQGEVVAGQVMMLKGENSAKVTERVKERVEEIRKFLPEGVILEPFLDRSELINRTINTVKNNLLEGGLIVIFILVLMLGNFRAGFIVASVIPLSMLFAFGMMKAFGVSANLMSLGAIDFGLVVDAAVIIVENIVHQLHTRFQGQKLSRLEMDKYVGESSVNIRKSAAFGEVIILIVYLPILTLSGIEGKMFTPMAQAVSFAILGALILSMTYVPMMSALMLNRNISAKKTLSDRFMDLLKRIYQPSLKLSLRFGFPLVLATIGVFGLTIYQFNKLGGEFIPTLEEGDFALHQILPPGSSLKQSVEVSGKIQQILLDRFPEVEKVVTKIGTAEVPTDIMPLEAGDIYVNLKPKEEWVTATNREDMFEKMEEAMKEVPGVIYEFTQPIQMLFNELMTGVRQDIAIKIYGENMGELARLGEEATAIIGQIAGTGDIKLEQVEGLEQMVITVDRERIAQLDLTVNEVESIIRMSFAGEKSGFLFEGDRRFDLVVRLKESQRQGIQNLEDLYIMLKDSTQVPLSSLAKIELVEGPSQVSRDNTRRRITIGVNARNRDVESLVTEIDDKLTETLRLPAGYYVTYGGQFENLIQARDRLGVVVPIALFLIFILLFFTFNSVKQALLIFTAIPLAAIGGVWGLWLRDMPFSISAGVGFIALFGVAVLNGIVLIASFNEFKKEGITNIKERVFKGTETRLRPVLMTALVASLGFLPMALSQTAGAEVQRPLATVVIFGLITSTLLTLLLLPVLYSMTTKK